jgi:16S rRNA (guanine527-N7)-methyltransferase
VKHNHHISFKNVPRETFIEVDRMIESYRKSINTYLDQLLWWNERINLVSRNVSRETINEHIRHSLLLSALAPFKEAEVVVDAGTGGGLPGIPLAIIHPNKEFVLNDIATKKMVAVKQIIRTLGLENTAVEKGSVGRLSLQKPFLLISKHAFKIDELWNLVQDKPWTQMVFYKGLDFEREVTGISAPLSIEVFRLEPHSRNAFYSDKALIVLANKS